jgi:hypothetical protein
MPTEGWNKNSEWINGARVWLPEWRILYPYR